MKFEEFREQLLKCRYCREVLGLNIEPKPLIWGEPTAKIVVIGQAPSRRASKCGRPFSKNEREPDASGKKFIEWLGVPREVFFNPRIFYITAVAHCYPGRGQGGDAPPPKICAKKWLLKELSFLNPKLYIIVGSYAANFLYPERKFTELVFQDLEFKGKPVFVIPHPSPANKKWFKNNPDFEKSRLKVLRKAVKEAIYG